MKAILGREIGKELIDALGLPRKTITVDLHCKADEPVTITCTYLADGDKLKTAMNLLTKNYALVDRDEVTDSDGEPQSQNKTMV